MSESIRQFLRFIQLTQSFQKRFDIPDEYQWQAAEMVEMMVTRLDGSLTL